MRLEQRLKRIEIEARPMTRVAERERRRGIAARFGMCKLMCYGFTQAEALDIVVESSRRMGCGPNVTVPHFAAPYIPELFQSFLDADSEAARLHEALAGYRTDAVNWSDTLESEHEQITPIVTQLLGRFEAYFMNTARADFIGYKKSVAEGERRLAASNEQSRIKN